MKTFEVPTTNRAIRRLLAQAGTETLVLTKGGKPVAALLPMEGMDQESLALGTSPKFLRIVRKSLGQLEKGKGVSLAEMRKRVG